MTHAKPQHIIVVGSGIAGLIAALRLSAQHDVTLITKNELAESNTRWAQGGIAAVMFPDDRIADHITDTLNAGAGLCDPAAVRILCEEGPARIHELIALGVAFDTRNGELAKGLEAAHSYPRILHAGGDSTGFSIEMALVRAVRSNPRIHVREHTFAADLILRNGQVSALEIIDADHRPHILPADAVLLASGGAGQLYLHTTNPQVATGDGTALALRAGAQLADLEFYQFHPTALAVGDTFLISEAVRGEGAILLDTHGHRFMQTLHPAAELAPRDIVARGIALQMAAQNGAPVLLDATKLEREHGAGFLAQRFPTIDAACQARGLDWRTTRIPVTPAAHYWMGGIRTDLHGRTSIPGLLAVGETACTGVHGANRLASNSLLESLVFASRAADLLLSHPSAALTPAEFDATPVHELPSTPHHASSPALASRYPEASASGLSALSRDGALALGANSPQTRRDLQTLMWHAAGIERNGPDLRRALAQLNAAHIAGNTIEDRETANLLQLSHALITAALAREESRGAHFRDDFPTPSAAWTHPLIYTAEAPIPKEHALTH
jgi:L-aspartate oxidase